MGSRCAPPQNKPTPEQQRRCFPYLVEELAALDRLHVLVGLGAIGTRAGYDAMLATGYVFEARPRFSHGAECVGRHAERTPVVLLASYHPSRQNTNTGVLTEPMLDDIFLRVRGLLSCAPGT
jgi:uracil-DNA glycosylase